MAATRRAQILMEPAEYRRLEDIARRRKISVAELIRGAVREKYLLPRDRRIAIAEEIAGMKAPIGDWGDVEKEIEDAHCADLR